MRGKPLAGVCPSRQRAWEVTDGLQRDPLVDEMPNRCRTEPPRLEWKLDFM